MIIERNKTLHQVRVLFTVDYKPTTPIFYCSQSVLVFYSRPLENNRKWVWYVYKQHNNLVVGLEFQYKTSHEVIILYLKRFTGGVLPACARSFHGGSSPCMRSLISRGEFSLHALTPFTGGVLPACAHSFHEGSSPCMRSLLI